MQTAKRSPISLDGGNYARRKLANAVATAAMVACTAIALIPLFLVVGYVVTQGWSSLVGHFPGVFATADGSNQLIDGLKGTALLIAGASIVGLPIGIFSGIFLSEFGQNRFGDIVRFVTDVMAGLPSIVVGIVGYEVLVATTGHYSVFAGSLALGLLMFPTVTRSTEGVMRLVPASLREGGLALGVTRWRTIVSVIIPAALSGIVTGVILGIARVAGETAPLIFTILGNNYGFTGWTDPISALPLQIYTFIVNPPDDPTQDQQAAFAGVMTLLLFVICLNLLARYLAGRRAVAGQ